MVEGRAGERNKMAFELVTSLSWLWERGKVMVYCPRETSKELKDRASQVR